MSRFLSVSDEDVVFTKHCIRYFILTKKLGVHPTLDPQDMGRLSSIWNMGDDIQNAEYRMLWREVEGEIHDR